jgi:hypothetical protein
LRFQILAWIDHANPIQKEVKPRNRPVATTPSPPASVSRRAGNAARHPAVHPYVGA